MSAGQGRQGTRSASRRAREVAEELGVELDDITGTGMWGAVTVADVRAYSEGAGGVEDSGGEGLAVELDGGDGVTDGLEEEPEPERQPSGGRWATELHGYADRLGKARARTLADVIRLHAIHVEDVAQGRLAPSAAVAPAGIDPAMVGKTLAAGRARRGIEAFVEVARNVLIFIPVLVTWFKIQSTGVDDLGDMRGTALAVVILIAVLIGMHVLLGGLRSRRAARGEQITRDFAGTLAAAEIAASPGRAESAENAVADFAKVGEELTVSLRGAGDSLAGARDVMTQMAETVGRQGEQVGELMKLLEPISRIGEQIGGAQRELSAVAATMGSTTRTLADIQRNLAPTSEQLGEAVHELGELAQQLDVTGKQLGRMTEVFAERFDPMDQSAAHFEEAVKSLTLISGRVLDEMEDIGRGRDGAGRRVGG